MHSEKSALLPSSSGTSNENGYGSTTVNLGKHSLYTFPNPFQAVYSKSVQIVWHHLRAEHQKSGKVIVDDAFGMAEPGELVALMVNLNV